MPPFAVLPTKRLLLLVAAAAPAWLLGSAPALAVDAVLLLAAVFDAGLAVRTPTPAFGRRAPGRIAFGAAAAVDVEVRNRAGRAVRLRVTDDLPVELVREGPAEAELLLAAGGSDTVSYAVRPDARGEHRLRDVHCRLAGPLGLIWHQRRTERGDLLRVQPGLAEVRRHRLLALRSRAREQLRRGRRPGQGRAFESLREYVRGDDPRRIDWKATARRSRLIVRQYEAERSQNLLLAIDAGRLMVERIGRSERIDHALSAALLMADVAAQHGDRVGALVFSDRVDAFLPPQRGALSALADAFVGVEARPVESDYPGAFSYLGRQLRRRSLIILFTDVIDPGTSGALLGHLRAVSRRHLALTVALRNPDVEAAAAATAEGEPDAYRRAAAEELLQARAHALEALRRTGVLVADTRPGEAGPAVVNRYVRVKSRGLL